MGGPGSACVKGNLEMKTTEGLSVQALLGRHLQCGGRTAPGLSVQTPGSDACV